MILIIDDRADKLEQIRAYWLACDAQATFNIAYTFDQGIGELARNKAKYTAIALNCLTVLQTASKADTVLTPADTYFAIRNIAPAVQLVITAGADTKLVNLLAHDKFAKLMQIEPEEAEEEKAQLIADNTSFCLDYSRSIGEHNANINNLWRELAETKDEFRDALAKMDTKLDVFAEKLLTVGEPKAKEEEDALAMLKGLGKLIVFLQSNIRLLILVLSLVLSIVTGQFNVLGDLYCKHALPGTNFCAEKVDNADADGL